MCNEARRLFEEYSDALSTSHRFGQSISETRVRHAIRMLANHRKNHGCCVALRFELYPPGYRWRFGLVRPDV
jgi:hypothetical protein